MIVTVEEMKNYLRLDYDEDDALLETLILTAEQIISDVLRVDNISAYEKDEIARAAAMYAVSYLYDNREKADHLELTLTLRALLQNRREYESHGF